MLTMTQLLGPSWSLDSKSVRIRSRFSPGIRDPTGWGSRNTDPPPTLGGTQISKLLQKPSLLPKIPFIVLITLSGN